MMLTEQEKFELEEFNKLLSFKYDEIKSSNADSLYYGFIRDSLCMFNRYDMISEDLNNELEIVINCKYNTNNTKEHVVALYKENEAYLEKKIADFICETNDGISPAQIYFRYIVTRHKLKIKIYILQFSDSIHMLTSELQHPENKWVTKYNWMKIIKRNSFEIAISIIIILIILSRL